MIPHPIKTALVNGGMFACRRSRVRPARCGIMLVLMSTAALTVFGAPPQPHRDFAGATPARDAERRFDVEKILWGNAFEIFGKS